MRPSRLPDVVYEWVLDADPCEGRLQALFDCLLDIVRERLVADLGPWQVFDNPSAIRVAVRLFSEHARDRTAFDNGA